MKKRVILPLVLVMSLATIHADPVFFSETGSWYDFVISPNGWTESKTAAEGMSYLGISGRLATINTPSENSFIIYSVLPDLPDTPKGYWIGGFQQPGSPEPDGGWGWITGEPWDFINWNVAEPNNLGTDSKFLMLYDRYPYYGRWNDASDDDAPWSFGYVIEYAAIPEPSAFALAGLGVAALMISRRRR